jgi:acetyl esterase/lipase
MHTSLTSSKIKNSSSFYFMKKILISSLIVVCFSAAFAQQQVISLYPGAAPGSEEWTWNEAVSDTNVWNTKVVYNVSKPTLTVFKPNEKMSNGTAVIIAPGGAFHALSINNEGFDVAKSLVKKGVTCFVLKYRLVHCFTNNPVAETMKKWGSKKFEDDNKATIPLSIADGKAAIAYVRMNAKDFNIDTNRIGIVGFSAGGCVAAATAYDYTHENKPNFVAPIYPFFPKEMQGSVVADAPPMFLAAASDDGLQLAPHSVALYNQWLNAKKTVELHLFSKGGHGFGMRKQNLPSDKWIDRFYDWLQVNGWLIKSS